MRRSRRVGYVRERLATPDGDELFLDHLEGSPSAPRLLLLHGLEGSSLSLHMLDVAGVAHSLGWSVTALNFRSCARELADEDEGLPNKTARLYHSGETEDLAYAVGALRAREPERPLAAYGISLGGNVLLKFLGERGGAAGIDIAVAVSVPFDLAAAARNLETRIGLVYTRHYLESLCPKFSRVAASFPEAAARVDVKRVLAARTFWEFDDAAVAPLHGFEGASDYYARSSSLAFLPRIERPVLLLSARDDPFSPPPVLERVAAACAPRTRLLVAAGGGHVGFVHGPAPWRARYWHVETAVEWLSESLARGLLDRRICANPPGNTRVPGRNEPAPPSI